MANRFNRLDNTAPVQKELEADSVNVGRSAHDFSCIHNGNALMGALIPVDCFDVVPNEDIDLSLAALVEFRNPTTRQLFNGFRVYFHAYYNRLTDLWEGAKNWIDNGRSGKVCLTRPNLIYHQNDEDSSTFPSNAFNCNTPMSLLNYLGLPAEMMYKYGSNTLPSSCTPLRSFQTLVKTNFQQDDLVRLAQSPDYFPADCAFAYQKNWRDYYSSKNLLQNNKYWFPDNEDHFILSYACKDAICVKYEDEDLLEYSGGILGTAETNRSLNARGFLSNFLFTRTPECNDPDTAITAADFSALNFPNLAALKFRQFRGDRFTTGVPFPDLIRGDIPVLEATQDAFLHLGLRDANHNLIYDSKFDAYKNTFDTGNYHDPVESWSESWHRTASSPEDTVISDKPDSRGLKLSSGNKNAYDLHLRELGVTMSDLYTLETLTNFRRRFGMTNGDYNDSIQSQFGVSPHVHDRKGTYIGGFYQDFAMNSVTQTSQSDQTPLGTKAGQGVSSGSGRIGHFHTPDYGWIQIYMSIMPDVYYTQGIPKMFSKKSNLEMYFPILNNLPSQAVLNKELYVSGDSSTDELPFAYEDRFAEYKSRQNRVSGFISLNPDVAEFDASRIIARRFTTTPALNSKFVTAVPENIDMTAFSVRDEPPFDFSIGISCRRVFPGPYVAIEGSLSSPKLNSF